MPTEPTNWVGRLHWRREDDGDGSYELDYSADNPVPDSLKVLPVVVIPLEELHQEGWRLVRLGGYPYDLHVNDEWAPEGTAP